MKTAAEMKARFAQQTADYNLIRDRAVEKLSKEWARVLGERIDVAFKGSYPATFVSVTANLFESPPAGQDREEIELLAADIVIMHFMNLGFNAYRHLIGSTPNQRVEVTWGE